MSRTNISAVRTRTANSSGDLLSTVAQQLVKHLGTDTTLGAQAISKALHQVLDGGSASALLARSHLQQYLFLVTQREIERQSQSVRAAPVAATMLTTQEAAQLMGCSRPHVAMLIDTGCLDGAVRTPKGHRRVPLASVQKWLLTHPPIPVGADTYREAGRDAGIYAGSVVDSANAVARRSRH